MLPRIEYERLIYTLPTQFPAIRFSTLVLAPPGFDIARLTGLAALGEDCVLCVYELLDFQQGVIEAYRYEVSHCRPPFTGADLGRIANPPCISQAIETIPLDFRLPQPRRAQPRESPSNNSPPSPCHPCHPCPIPTSPHAGSELPSGTTWLCNHPVLEI